MHSHKDAPLVSVIVIFRDAEPFLSDAVESILAQSYASWELLLVDDGSSDGSTTTAQRFAEKHSAKVHYLEHDGHVNRGMSASRNLGVASARGIYIAFLDADDVWLTGKLESQVAILETHRDVAMTYGPARYWFEWRPAAPNHDFVQDVGFPAGSVVAPPQLLHAFIENEGCTPAPSAILVRRNALLRVGGFEPEFRGMYEDQAFYAKLCLSESVYISGDILCLYRQHENAACAVAIATGQSAAARHRFLVWLQGLLTTHRLADNELRSAVAAQLRPFQLLAQFRLRARRMLGNYRKLKRLRQRAAWPPFGWGRIVLLGRTTPVSRDFGFNRGSGNCIDRYYIDRFLEVHTLDLSGRVLEVGDVTYTRRFGGNRVTQSHVLHIDAHHPDATVVADLSDGDSLESEAFDCIVLTQTLHLIFDLESAVRTLYRILAPGGILLVTVPGISQISRYDADRWGDYWRFTTLSLRRLLDEAFHSENVAVNTYGNVTTAVGFLHGLVVEDMRPADLDRHDSDYQVLLAARAVKPR